MFFCKTTSNLEFSKFAILLSQYDYKIKTYDILAGRIIGLEEQHAIVDLGLKKVAFLPLKEIYTELPNYPYEVLKHNFISEFFVLIENQKTDQIIISLKQIHILYSWQRLKQIDFKNVILYSRLKINLSHGKILDFHGLKFYTLNSHIPKYYKRQKDTNFLIPFKVIEVKDSLHMVHVNAKLALISKLSNNLKINFIYKGTISSIKNFGIFINILGLKCLLHRSKISEERSFNLNSLYKLGHYISVKIFYKNLEQGQILLMLKNTNTNHLLQ